MTTSGNLSVLRRPLRVPRANWQALLLPLVAAGMLGLFGVSWPLMLASAAALVTVIAPAESAKIAPFALIAYGAYGLFLMHSLLVWEKQPVLYGFVQASRGSYPTWHTSGPLGLVLTEAVAFMAARWRR